MSYDVWLEIDTGGPKPAMVSEEQNPTYNLAPMFARALGKGLRECVGMSGKDLTPLLENAVLTMETDPGMFKALNPPNGWGTYDHALEFFVTLLEQCREHPLAVLHV